MNSEQRYALAAARVLREQLPPVQPVRELAHRDRIVMALEIELARQVRRRRAVWAGTFTLAAAAGVLLVLKLTHPGAEPSMLVERSAGPGNLLLRQGQSQALATAAPVLEGDEIQAGQAGSASLGLGRGTRVELASASRMRVVEAGHTRRFFLLHGRVDASVAKLHADERLLVSTPDGEVEVRGTRFSVNVADAPAGCGGASQRSTVEVQEGTVWVRFLGEEIVLTAGQSLARPCAAESVVQEPTEALAPTAPAPEERKPSARRRGPAAWVTPSGGAPAAGAQTSAATLEPESRLAEQNDLLSSAMAAARAGQNNLALRRLDDLLARFPDGPLSETAHIERQRIKAAQTNQR